MDLFGQWVSRHTLQLSVARFFYDGVIQCVDLNSQVTVFDMIFGMRGLAMISISQNPSKFWEIVPYGRVWSLVLVGRMCECARCIGSFGYSIARATLRFIHGDLGGGPSRTSPGRI